MALRDLTALHPHKPDGFPPAPVDVTHANVLAKTSKAVAA